MAPFVYTVLGPSGGPDGHERGWHFDEDTGLRAISVRCGHWVDRIMFWLEGSAVGREGVGFGGDGGSEQQIYILKQGEKISRIVGTFGRPDFPFVNSIEFVTNFNGHYGPWGSVPGPASFEYEIPQVDGITLGGFFGRSDDHVNAFGIYLRLDPNKLSIK
jgi:hypothetical protein